MMLGPALYKFFKSRRDLKYYLYSIGPLLLIMFAKSVYFNHSKDDYLKATYGICDDENIVYRNCIFVMTYIRLLLLFYMNYVTFLIGNFWYVFFLGIFRLLGLPDCDLIEEAMNRTTNTIDKEMTTSNE